MGHPQRGAQLIPASGWVMHCGEEAEPMASLLEQRGLGSWHLPLIARRPLGLPPPALVPELVICSSAASVSLGGPALVQALAGRRIWAVGRATAAALVGAGLAVERVGQGGAAELLERAGEGPLWLAGARDLAEPTRAALAARRGAWAHWSLYETRARCPTELELEDLLAAALRGELRAACFASPSAIEAWPPGPPPAPLLCIGSTTAAAARGRGWRPAGLARRPGMAELADAAAELVAAGGPGEARRS